MTGHHRPPLRCAIPPPTSPPPSSRRRRRRCREPAGTPARDSRRWLILAVIGVAQLMVVLDATIVNIALPSAQRALGFSTADRQWVVTAYALAFGGLLLVGGRLSDLFGRKRTFVAGLAGFAVASAAGGAAPEFAVLVAARAVQGAFGALLAPSALALLTTTFSRPPGARQGPGHLHRDHRRRRRDRPAARRGADRVPVVALVPLRQRRLRGRGPGRGHPADRQPAAVPRPR